ncbi:alcohol dehydrogenase catalytic domain-containing protein [Amycolatopsis acidiphila]|uniref:Zinc-binding dehydrogenase n=1 Tax=Amycolatopsis acidiphila TaxID=715473 RepID=A0A557ZRI0_9PSEU|nr:alcohol dehydrogenase catalytic domain-containing protein [Amycolatopsis acidiphila]TVT14637.1 zinc-binding dehydrogenase [Amycolatopsis acidiphila]UIJ60745.1 alcohol dehydrogenase catalytic domain-containing protein [Amycolatopsis acidiphila]GHG91075.1 dehydrogenase [Amycolatopsis acidiphila]
MSRAVVIERPRELRLVRIEPQLPGHGEAVVRVAWSGICGSDREVFAGTRAEGYVRYPVTPGHEWSGTVVELGPGTDQSLLGKQVVGEGFRNCARCDACRRGDTNLCEAAYDETGFTRPGAWADELRLPARLLHELPADADLRAAALLEPAACMAAAALTANVVPGERVAVVGGGTLGMLAVQLLAASSPGSLVVVDPRRDRLELARRFGATSAAPEDDLDPFDAVVEAAGAPGTGSLAVGLTKRGGRTVLTGLAGTETVPLVPADLVAAAVTVHTVFGASSAAWTHAVRAFATGLLDPAPLITHEFALENAEDALATIVGKVLLHP